MEHAEADAGSDFLDGGFGGAFGFDLAATCMTTERMSQRLTLIRGGLLCLRHQECLDLRVRNDNRFGILTVSTGRKLSEEDYQAEVVLGTLTRAVLENFQRLSQENNGFPRYAVTSGRLWRHLNIPGQPVFSIMPFWKHGFDRPDGPALEVVQALKVEGPIYLVSSEKTRGAWHSLPAKRPA